MIVKYIKELEQMLESPRLYVHPFIPEMVETYLQGLNRGILISNELLNFNDIIHARRDATIIRGWSGNALGPLNEMRKKRVSEDEIINEFINIEIDTWRLIEKSSVGQAD
jgi:hypothetical protein